MFTTKYILKHSLLTLIIALLFIQCTNDNEPVKSEDPIKIDQGSNIMNFNGQLFSIPSPIQTAKLIKATGAEFNNNLVNSIENLNLYNSTYKQALNLGVYGADFAYVSYYGQDETSIKYMKNLRKLIDELDLGSVMDDQFVERIGENIENQDSLMTISSDMFRAADNYLKSSDQANIAGLILAGGFIESLYFSSNLAKMDPSGELAKRVGEQKQTVSNIVLLLGNDVNKQSQDLYNEFKELEKVFENVQVNYQYAHPETDPAKKVTVIKSSTEVIVSDKVLEEILVKITSIRTLITG